MREALGSGAHGSPAGRKGVGRVTPVWPVLLPVGQLGNSPGRCPRPAPSSRAWGTLRGFACVAQGGL